MDRMISRAMSSLSRGESKVLVIEFAQARGLDFDLEKDTSLIKKQKETELEAVIQVFAQMDKAIREAELQPYVFV